MLRVLLLFDSVVEYEVVSYVDCCVVVSSGAGEGPAGAVLRGV